MLHLFKKGIILIWIGILMFLFSESFLWSGIQMHEDLIREQVNSIYITQTIDVLSRMPQMKETLALWKGAYAERCILEWACSEEFDRLIEKNWIYLVEKSGQVVGLIGTDPETGEFCWRATWNLQRHMNHINGIFFTEPETIEDAVENFVELDSNTNGKYDLDNKKLVFIEGNHYWMIPNQTSRLEDDLLLPVAGLDKGQILSVVKKVIVEKRQIHINSAGMSPGNLAGREFKPPPRYLEKKKDLGITKDSASILSENTSMVGEVPIYYQGSTSNCWAFSLAMIHQWWSPIMIDTGSMQALKIRVYLGKDSDDGATLWEAKDVMENWDGVDTRFEDFVTTTWGEGKAFATGEPTWILNDPKTWLAMECPVYASIDSDGTDTLVDHAIVIIGYSDIEQEVYINNPWGYEDTYSYSSFNDDYWGAAWNALFDKRGMIGGFPGDDNYIGISSTSVNFPDLEMYDDEKVIVQNIGMTVSGDDAGGGWDSFHDTEYYNYFTASMGYHIIPDLLFYYGETAEPVSNGTWWSHTPVPPDRRIIFKKQSMSPGQSVQNASFYVKVDPDQMFNSIRVSYGWLAWDRDNRHHSSKTIMVYDDRSSVGGFMMMKKPIRDSAYLSSYKDIQVYDDDDYPPVFTNLSTYPLSPVAGDYKNSLVLSANVSDSSGVAYVNFIYRYGSGPNHVRVGTVNYFKTSRPYECSIPLTEWNAHRGETLYWKIEAADADNDWTNDPSVGFSTEQSLVLSEVVYTWSALNRLTWTSTESENPALCLDPNQHVHVVWQDKQSGNFEIYHKKSTDQGNTWSAVHRLTYSGNPSVTPDIDISSEGTVYVVWNDSSSGNGDIYFKKSTDGGSTWSALSRMTWNNGDSRNPKIKVDSGGTLHVAWQDKTPGNYEILYRRSTNGGAAWSALKRLTWTSGDSCHPALDAGGDGRVHVLWDDVSPGNAEIYYKNSSDNGVSWPGAQRLTYNSGYSWAGDVMVKSSANIHVFWSDLSPTNAEIHHKRSTNVGSTWLPPQRLTWNSGGSWSADACEDNAENFHLVWHDFTPGNAEIYHKTSPDGGSTWVGTERLTWNSGESKKPRIAVSNVDCLYVVWQDNSMGNAEIFFKSRF